jgi:hypothetical protein
VKQLIFKGAIMGWFDIAEEGKDYFIPQQHRWSAPLASDGDFQFEGTLFSWRSERKSLRYPYGAGEVVIRLFFDVGQSGFFGSDGNGYEVCATVNGILALNCEWNTERIKNKELRAAVELGLRAWQAQLAASKAAALDALSKHA